MSYLGGIIFVFLRAEDPFIIYLKRSWILYSLTEHKKEDAVQALNH